MKQATFKRIAAIILGMSILGVLIFGLISILGKSNPVNAEETPNTTVTLSVDKEELLPGDTFVMTLEITTIRTNTQWGSTSLLVTPTDNSLFQHLSLSKPDIQMDEAFLDKVYEPTLVRSTTDMGIRFSVPFKGEYDDNSGAAIGLSTADYPYVLKAEFKVAETISPDTVIDFTIPANNKWAVSYFVGDSPDEESDTGKNGSMKVVGTSVKIRKIGNDSSLSKLIVGIGNEEQETFTANDSKPIDLDLTYNYEQSDEIKNIKITPTLSDEKYAVAYIGVGANVTETTGTEITSGEEQTLDLVVKNPWETLAVSILVKAENGDTTTYKITIIDKYVAISSLVIDVGTNTEGVTKIGLQEGVTFSPDTLSYTVDVPSDYDLSDTKVTVTPTVAEGHGIKETIALAGTNSSPANNSVTSGSPVQVTGISDDGTLTLTVTASDNTTTKVYTVTFKVWSVETGDITVKVQGESKTYESDEEKESEAVQYYFLLSDEAECKGKFLITNTLTGIPVKIGTTTTDDGEDYDAAKEYGAGTYYIILTAPAGNVKKYTAVLTKQEFLELIDETSYDFLFEEELDDDGEIYTYRRSYKEKGIAHGFDDKGKTIVIGHIMPETSVNAFLQNIIPSQRSMVRLYTNKNVLIYNQGSPAEDITADELNNSDDYRIGTSWYLQFGGTEEAPLETVYLSVLGDVNCDGYVDARDITRINQYIKEVVQFNAVEVRLAAYVSNKGYISAFDISETNKVIKEVKKIEDYYFKLKN